MFTNAETSPAQKVLKLIESCSVPILFLVHRLKSWAKSLCHEGDRAPLFIDAHPFCIARATDMLHSEDDVRKAEVQDSGTL